MLQPRGDGFRNYVRPGGRLSPETLLLERANMLTLTAPETTVLLGGMRALGANHGRSPHGVLTDRPGTLTNDFFVNVLDAGTEWSPSQSDERVYERRDAGNQGDKVVNCRSGSASPTWHSTYPAWTHRRGEAGSSSR